MLELAAVGLPDHGFFFGFGQRHLAVLAVLRGGLIAADGNVKRLAVAVVVGNQQFVGALGIEFGADVGADQIVAVDKVVGGVLHAVALAVDAEFFLGLVARFGQFAADVFILAFARDRLACGGFLPGHPAVGVHHRFFKLLVYHPNCAADGGDHDNQYEFDFHGFGLLVVVMR